MVRRNQWIAALSKNSIKKGLSSMKKLWVLIIILMFPLLICSCDVYQKDAEGRPMRINRFTGKVYIFTPRQGWVEIKNLNKCTKNLNDKQLSLITGNGRFNSEGEFTAELYNGTEYYITEMTILIIVRNKDGSLTLERSYKTYNADPLIAMFTSIIIDSFSNSTIKTADTGINMKEGQKFEWTIVEAKGYKK